MISAQIYIIPDGAIKYLRTIINQSTILLDKYQNFKTRKIRKILQRCFGSVSWGIARAWLIFKSYTS